MFFGESEYLGDALDKFVMNARLIVFEYRKDGDIMEANKKFIELKRRGEANGYYVAIAGFTPDGTAVPKKFARDYDEIAWARIAAHEAVYIFKKVCGRYVPQMKWKDK